MPRPPLRRGAPASGVLLLLVAVGSIALIEGVVHADPTDSRRGRDLRTPQQVAARIDETLAAGWKEAGVEPTGPASDVEFLRRVSLDLNGVIPTEETARNFLTSRSRTKRAQLVQHLLEDPGYGRTLALRWGYLLVGRDYLMRSRAARQVQQAMARRARMAEMQGETMQQGQGQGESSPLPDEVLSLTDWLAQQFERNVPWDEVTRELLTAEGTLPENPAAHYVFKHLRGGKAEDLTGNVMRVFQGLQIQCAQCHDHPYEAWSQRDFYGVAAYFTRTATRRAPPTPEQLARAERRAEAGKKQRKVRGPYMVIERPRGQIRVPAEPGQTGALVLPRYLTGQVTNPSDRVDRREALADLVTAPDNPWFAKATVNRIWSFFFGRGIVEPVDAIGAASSPLLDLLAADFRASGHDVRRLVEVIVSTRAYGLSSAGPIDVRDAQLELFARAPLRPLTAEQLFYSVLEATGAEDIRTRDRRAKLRLERRKYQLLRQFVSTFGDDEGEEVVQEGTIPQALMRFNGPLTNEAVRPRPGHPVYDRLFGMKDLDARIELIYLRILSRPPTAQERRTLRELLGPQPAGRMAAAYADVFWALLNSSEFNFNH